MRSVCLRPATYSVAWLSAVLAVVTSLVLTTPLGAQFTGTWAGTYPSVEHDCTPPVTSTRAIGLSITQTGNSVSGIANYESSLGSCDPTSAGIVVSLPLTAVANGSTLTGSFIYPDDQIPTPVAFTATVTGGTMSMTWYDAPSTVNGTLTQTSGAAPDTTATGSYVGTYTITEPHAECPSLPTLTYSGPFSGSLVQSGPDLAGVLIASSTKAVQACTAVSAADTTAQLSVQINGTSLSGYLIFPTDVQQVTGTMTGSTLTITGTSMSGQGTNRTTSFTISRGSPTLPPSITSFSASPATINPGGTSTLSWATVNASGVSIDGVGDSLPLSGTLTVQPAATTTYTLTATGSGGSATAKTTVTVASVGPPANVFVSAFPSGMLQATGAPLPTDRYTLTNLGGTDTAITLAQSGSFFTQTPSSFNLPAYSSAVVFITATAQPAGTYQGSSNASGNGVMNGMNIPIRLLVAAAPGAPVTVTSGSIRTDVTGPAGPTFPSGSVSFTNPGTAAIQGVVSPDVPWIVLFNGFLSLAPSETKQVQFTIDRTRRPDGTFPIGGATGSLTFRYVNAAAGKAEILGTTVVSGVSVQIVDVVTLNAASNTPMPLGPGEVAISLAGVSSKLGAISDLALSNRTGSSIMGLKLYLFPPGGSSGAQVIDLPQLGGQASVSFPGVLRNFFSAASQTGVLQLRGSQLSQNSVAVAGTQITSTLGQSYVTALPLSRSDRGALPGDAMDLPGVQKSATQTTNVYVHELTGSTAALTIEFFDASGSAIGSPTSHSVSPFGLLELPDVVPVNAATVRVKNTSTGGAKINAYALVIDSATGDAFAIVQTGATTDPMFCPAFGAASGAGRDMFLNLSNASAGAITVTVTTLCSGMRRRATNHSIAEPLGGSSTVVTIPGNAFRQVRVTDAGIVRVSGSTAVRVAGMYSIPKSGGAVGSGVAALPTSRALAANSIRRFSGIEDASADAVAAARPLTYRTNLMLAETAGQAATVRLTLRYVFSAGVTVSAGAVTSRDYELQAGGFVLLSNLAESIIGPGRGYLGDLHNAVLDVAVVAGGGSVLPFIQVIDNRTGEVTVRSD